MYFSIRVGALCTPSDDTYGAGTQSFMAEVDKLMSNFRAHRSDVNDVRFAGLDISKNPDGIITDGNTYPGRISLIPTPAGVANEAALPDLTAYKSAAAGHLWLARIARPDRACDASMLCNSLALTHADAVHLNKLTTHVRDNPLTLVYPILDTATLRILAFSDYSGSPETPARRHHQGHLIVLTDASHRFAPLHWGSRRPRRTVHSTGGGELLALADAISDAVDIRSLLQELLAQPIPITAFSDAAAA